MGHLITLKNRGGKSFTTRKDEAIIDAAERQGYVLPIACRYGGCITCAGKLITGKVRQPKGTALNKRQSQLGFILLCVARPQSDCVIDVGVDSHDGLYQNPFSVAPKTYRPNLVKSTAKTEASSEIAPVALPQL